MSNDKFVSRAGEKLQYAIEQFEVDVKGKVCADFGSSTGGFVDVLLKSGAKKVYSIDTSYGELDWNLRNDDRVKVLERTNAMHVKLPEYMDIITIDTGWTKQEKVIPNALKNLKEDGIIISLIKPHYEAPKKYLHKGKLQEDMVEVIVKEVKEKLEKLNLKIEKIVESPITGARAENREFLALILPKNTE